MNFEGKTVLVTGASRGIGRAIAQRFASLGARVAVHYGRSKRAADETLASLQGEGHFIVQADLVDAEAVRDLVEVVIDTMDRIDILVNNAGIYEDHPLAEVSYDNWQDNWERILRTNLLGPANLIYCAAQYMIPHGGGRIVNVSSRGAFRGEPTAPAYGASKAGLNAMGQSLAVALAPMNITVATVAPGWVETDMARSYLEDGDDSHLRKQSPFERMATPEEVAAAVVFLASEDATFASGSILDVNGASYLRT